MSGRDKLKVLAGLGMLLSGQKLPALASVGAGLAALERAWREAHPEVGHSFEQRWQAAREAYERAHTDATHRKLQQVSVPLIVGGAAGLLLTAPFRPLWLGSAASFAAGLALNVAGQALFEKTGPAFPDDPLAFFAGPLSELRESFAGEAPAPRGEVTPG